MALWSHHGTLMCRVFSLSLGDLGIRWFKRIPASSIGDFIELFESFVDQFIINTKASNGVSSLLSIRKGSNKSLKNYNKRYWELYNEISGFSSLDAQRSSRSSG